MMPIMPLVRVASADQGIDLAKKVEHGFRHTNHLPGPPAAEASRLPQAPFLLSAALTASSSLPLLVAGPWLDRRATALPA